MPERLLKELKPGTPFAYRGRKGVLVALGPGGALVSLSRGVTEFETDDPLRGKQVVKFSGGVKMETWSDESPVEVEGDEEKVVEAPTPRTGAAKKVSQPVDGRELRRAAAAKRVQKGS